MSEWVWGGGGGGLPVFEYWTTLRIPVQKRMLRSWRQCKQCRWRQAETRCLSAVKMTVVEMSECQHALY